MISNYIFNKKLLKTINSKIPKLTVFFYLLKNADCKMNKIETYIALIPTDGHK